MCGRLGLGWRRNARLWHTAEFCYKIQLRDYLCDSENCGKRPNCKPHLASVILLRWHEIVTIYGFSRAVDICKELGDASEPILREMLRAIGHRLFDAQKEYYDLRTDLDLRSDYSVVANAWTESCNHKQVLAGAVNLIEHWLFYGISEARRAFQAYPNKFQEKAIVHFDEKFRDCDLSVMQRARALNLTLSLLGVDKLRQLDGPLRWSH